MPMPPYQPQVWGACALTGADPNKVVRTFYRAPLTAGFNSMPAGDSVLYCGNDKYGFLHVANEHGDQDRNTFAVYRNIYRITEDGAVYAFTCRVVVSASEGKIITAFPSTEPV